jgi:hypothetical protein
MSAGSTSGPATAASGGPSTCPACGAAAFASDKGVCERCGYASGEGNRCPLCGAIARIEGTGRSAVCAVCGGPRIPGGFGGQNAIAALREEKKHRSDARASSIATIVQGMFAAIAALIALAILPASLIGKVVVLAMALSPILLALRSRSRATKARALASAANERAWQAAAEEIAERSKQGVTAAELASKLGLPATEADRILTSLAVHDRTRVDVGDDAEVRYSVAPEIDAQARARIAADELEAEHEAAAAHETNEPRRAQ